MSKMTRFAFALLSLGIGTTSPLGAYTVEQMKEMEARVKALVEKNTPSVVSLIGEKSPGAGSGTIVTADGLILTAAHVTKGNDYMVVVFPNGKQSRCKVLGSDYKRDVSLAKIEQPGTYVFTEVGDSKALEPTTVVVAMGHPGGYDLRRTPPVRIGRIVSKDLGGFLVSDATLIGGDSGGPLFNLEGKVIGVHSSIGTSLAFNRCAPTEAAKVSWDRMLAGERWGVLGLPELMPGRGGNARAVMGAVFDKQSTTGVKITEVSAKSPAEAAGLKAGDVIIKIDGDDVKTSEELSEQIGNSKPGDKVEIVYQRDGTEQKAQLTLISRGEMNKRLGVEESQRRRPRPRQPGLEENAPEKP